MGVFQMNTECVRDKVTDIGFTVWGLDRAPYGPVELPTLVNWIQDERVTADTWIFICKNGTWQRATEIPELQMFFRPKARVDEPAANGINPRALRRIKILSAMTDEQLERFAQFTETQRIQQWALVVHEGDPGDAMFFILEGEFRVRTEATGRETLLDTLGTGEFFGDICLFDGGLRSADVVANTDGVLLRLSLAAFERLTREARDLATPVVLAMGRTLGARLRKCNKRFSDSLVFAGAI
jgi:hypothetical protein